MLFSIMSLKDQVRLVTVSYNDINGKLRRNISIPKTFSKNKGKNKRCTKLSQRACEKLLPKINNLIISNGFEVGCSQLSLLIEEHQDVSNLFYLVEGID